MHRLLPSKPTLALLLALSTACGGGKESAPPAPRVDSAPRPHVVVLVLDACRADRFGAYGFARPTTPAFDALAAEPDGVLFRWQLSQAPHTRASTASLFTGVYPFQHGVFNDDDLTTELKRKGTIRGRGIVPEYETLAERFTAGGYRTAAQTANPIIPARDGFDQGFGRFFGPGKNDDPESDAALVDRTLAFLAEGDSPAFAYTHTSGCHTPFPIERQDGGYLERFGDPAGAKTLAAARLEPGSRKLKFAVRDRDFRLDPPSVAHLSAVYEAVLRKSDEDNIARMVDGLRRSGLYDRTLLVVTSDHGDELYDHGGLEHGRTLWNEVLHVPLVVKFPKGARPAALPARVERVTQTIDLYPGLLGAVGIEPAQGIAGHDLFAAAARSELAYSQAPGLWSLVDFPYKAIVLERRKRAELYDFAADPKETNDLAATKSDELRRLVRLGEGLRKALPKLGASTPEGELALDPETIEQLRSLGYIQ